MSDSLAASSPQMDSAVGPTAVAWLPRPLVWAIALLLLAGYGGMCLKIADETSPTFDEPDQVAVGYYALVTGYRPYTNINLTFTQMWSALPLLLSKTPPEIELPPDAAPPSPPPLLSKPGAAPVPETGLCARSFRCGSWPARRIFPRRQSNTRRRSPAASTTAGCSISTRATTPRKLFFGAGR